MQELKATPAIRALARSHMSMRHRVSSLHIVHGDGPQPGKTVLAIRLGTRTEGWY